MSSLVAKIKDIEDEMARTQINKQTMAHICGLRAKLAKYKRELLFDGPKTGAQGAGEGFDVRQNCPIEMCLTTTCIACLNTLTRMAANGIASSWIGRCCRSCALVRVLLTCRALSLWIRSLKR